MKGQKILNHLPLSSILEINIEFLLEFCYTD